MMHPLFTAHPLFDKAWQDYFTVVVAVILTILVFKLRNESKNINGYSSRLAWIRGVFISQNAFSQVGGWVFSKRSPARHGSQQIILRHLHC